MKLSRLVEMLNEFGSPGQLHVGVSGRADDSGVRGKGAKRPVDRRSDDFPYDRDVSYGQPSAYDRGSSGGSNLHGPLTPKDDSKFSLRLLGLDDVEEAMGTPTFFARSAQSDIGSVVPGVMIGWANDPPRDWDEGEDIDESPLTIDPRPPDTEEIPNAHTPDFRMQTDDDLENRLDRIWGREDNLNFVDPKLFARPDSHVIAPDPWSVINARLSSRGLYGLMPKESAWDRVSGMVLVKRKIS